MIDSSTGLNAMPALRRIGSLQRYPAGASESEMDAVVLRLKESAGRWAALRIEDRLALARSMLAGYHRIAERSVHEACAAKGIARGTTLEGEEWTTGPWCVIRHLRLISEALASIARTGTTRIGPVSTVADGRLATRVFPGSGTDGFLFAGITAEVRFRAEMTSSAMQEARAGFYKRPSHAGSTVLVLGAGNLASIPAMDVITKMFNEGKVCVLKMNPVNAYLGPFIEEAFTDAIARGFLAVVYGGAQEGAYLVRHPAIDEIHLTGSSATYDELVWGAAGPEREARKARNAAILAKPITAELGCVSPVLIVPARYGRTELAFQAEAVAGAVTSNASFLCNAAKVIVSPRGWARRRELLDSLEGALGHAPLRDAYYPGAAERWHRLTRGRHALRTIGTPRQGQLPWALLSGLDAEDPSEAAFQTEAFCSLIAETEVASDDPLDYLTRAVDFVNARLWGTLSATLIVHPSTMKDPVLAAAVEAAIGRLRYGTVAVNAWSGLSFAFGSPPWGAYPGSTPTDIQSGTGFVHNTAMLEGVEKVVLRHPLTLRPKPVTFPSHRTAHLLGRRLVELEARPSWAKAASVVAAAVRG
jgi:acyl-CoA reductase-like NAD-dependent aldehyde dehydrogenase